MNIVLKGQPRTKKNSQQIRTGYAGNKYIQQSELYKQYEEDCLWQLLAAHIKSQPIPPPPYNIKCIYYRSDKRVVDLSNLTEATDDILVAGGVIPDDCCGIIAGHDGSRVKFDKENPRTEIEVTHCDDTDLLLVLRKGKNYNFDKKGEN